MSDYYSEPHIEGPTEVLPPPSEHSSLGEDSKAAIQGIKDEIFDAIANSPEDDATAYVNERRDREADERGEKLSPEREKARLDRYTKALETAGDDYTHAAHEQLTTEQHQTDELKRFENSVRATTKYEMRVSDFEKANPDYREVIQSTFSILPLAEHVAEAFIHSPIGPELTYRLAHNVEAIDQINAMSPDELRVELARVEGMMSERQASQRNAPPARRATKAPPPMRQIRGGSASPAFDPSTASMEEYAAKRRGGWRG